MFINTRDEGVMWLACAQPKGEVHLWYLSCIRNEMTSLGLAWEER